MISRRAFLAGAACAGAASPRGNSALVYLSANCALPESRAGYLTAFPGTQGEFPACGMLILPAANLDTGTAGRLAEWVRRGCCLLLESGAGFADPPVIERQRALLQSHFGLETRWPIDLWGPAERDPYIHYSWPLSVRLRDFSRVVPPASGSVIARAGALPVASRLTPGRGTLIFAGSPLGPLLLAGDLDARRWLETVWPSSLNRA